MSASISFCDLKLIDSLSGFNSIEMLNPGNDVVMLQALESVGFDIRQIINYIPLKHRTLAGKVVVDFVAIGEISRHPKFKNMLDVMSRVVVAGMSDPSLGRELGNLMGRTRSYEPQEGVPKLTKRERQFREENDFDLLEGEEDFQEYIEDDWEFVQTQIQQLADIRDVVRANVNIKQTGKGK